STTVYARCDEGRLRDVLASGPDKEPRHGSAGTPEGLLRLASRAEAPQRLVRSEGRPDWHRVGPRTLAPSCMPGRLALGRPPQAVSNRFVLGRMWIQSRRFPATRLRYPDYFSTPPLRHGPTFRLFH